MLYFNTSVIRLFSLLMNSLSIQIGLIVDGAMVIGFDGMIVAVGKTDEIMKKFENATFKKTLNLKGKAIVPGLCDAHTHPVWNGDRVHEFAMKLNGATYMDIHKMGGGIGLTVRHTRASSDEELEKLFHDRIRRMTRFGTTLLEAKSGYGLNLDGEIKLLKVIHNISKRLESQIDIVGNYCGAHSVPKESNLKDYTKEIIETHLPAIKDLATQKVVSPELIDVFCEKGVFGVEESRAVLQAGYRIAGLKANFHGDELNPLHSAEMGAELDFCVGISHLEHISYEGIRKMAEKKIVGVLLPTTAYVLRIAPPPARKMIDSNVPVALGSDFNPNAHCLSMPFVMNLACVNMKLTMNEALVAATLNAAASMGRSSTNGSLEVGKKGDFLILDCDNWEHLIYQLVDPPIAAVYKNGEPVYEKDTISSKL